MDEKNLERQLAFILFQFPSQAKSRLIQILPPLFGKKVLDLQKTVTEVQPSGMNFIEQVLHADLEGIFKQGMNPKDYLFSESIQLRVSDVISLLLRHTSPQRAAEIVILLPRVLQGEVLHKIVAQDWEVLERRLGRAEADFLERIESLLDSSPEGNNSEFVAEILRRIKNTGILRRLLTEMYRMDPESADDVRDQLYGFEELVQLTDRELQIVLTGIDNWDLVLALRLVSKGLKQVVLSNISGRKAQYLSEDEEILEEMDEVYVFSAQQQVVDRVRQLYEAGKLHTYFGSIGEEEDLSIEDENKILRESPSNGEGFSGKLFHRRFNLMGMIIPLASIVIVVLFLVWFLRSRSISRSHGIRTVKTRLIDDMDFKPGVPKKGKEEQIGQGNIGESSFEFLVKGHVILVSGESERLAKGKVPKLGDWVKTDGDGRVFVSLWAGLGQLQVEENSLVQVGQGGKSWADGPQVNLRVGNLWVQVLHPTLEIMSPLAKIKASEGALFHVRVVLDATTTVFVHQGTVWIESLGKGEDTTQSVDSGDVARILPSGWIEIEKHEKKSKWLGGF